MRREEVKDGGDKGARRREDGRMAEFGGREGGGTEVCSHLVPKSDSRKVGEA